MILLLGGTAEARELAARLVAAGQPVTSSLAGRVSAPARPVGAVRIGGFGGVPGLIDYLRHERIDCVVDATHPFAATISAHAAAACAASDVPLLRLERPGWGDHPQASAWTWVADLAAARVAAGAAVRPFLTTGRSSLSAFTAWSDRIVMARVVDPPDNPVPETWRLIRSRGPYTLAGERALMTEHGTDVLLSKDSGGRLTVAKLDAAAELGVAVVMVRRPEPVPGVPRVDSVDAAVAALRRWAGVLG